MKKDTLQPTLASSFTLVTLKWIKLREELPNGTYKVVVSFVINQDAIIDIDIKKDPGYGIGEAVKKALIELPRSDPKMFNSLKSKGSQFTLPFILKMSE